MTIYMTHLSPLPENSDWKNTLPFLWYRPCHNCNFEWFIYCKQKEASSSFIVTVKIILYLYGTPRPLTSLHMSWQLKPFTPPDLKYLKIDFKDQERFVLFLDNPRGRFNNIFWIVWIIIGKNSQLPFWELPPRLEVSYIDDCKLASYGVISLWWIGRQQVHIELLYLRYLHRFSVWVWSSIIYILYLVSLQLRGHCKVWQLLNSHDTLKALRLTGEDQIKDILFGHYIVISFHWGKISLIFPP